MSWRSVRWICLAGCLALPAFGQKTLTWEMAKQKMKAANPTLQAGELAIQESKADEVTAFLRPNPDVAFSVDQVNLFNINPSRPLTNSLPQVTGAYLVERRHKRELRKQSAEGSTAIASSQQADLERSLIFDLRNAFVSVLQQKAVVKLTRENLAYYDDVLQVSRNRFTEGDISQVDLDRLELARVQFEADAESALVSLRTAKIELLALLSDRTPVNLLDVSGPYEFGENPAPLEAFRQMALDSRPDLRAAFRAVDKAKTDYQLAIANGSTDPTLAFDIAREADLRTYVGFSVTFPLRIFDRNQGEKARTLIDIRRSERLAEATRVEVFSDVDSAYATLQSALNLLRPYKAHYLDQAMRVRETISFAYQHGGASLLDFLQAQEDFRNIQLSYLNLVGAYLSAVNQLNFAVGREVIQ